MDCQSGLPVCGHQASVGIDSTTVNLGDSGLVDGVGEEALSPQWTGRGLPHDLGAAALPDLLLRFWLLLPEDLVVVSGDYLCHIWHGAV